jgi:ADP-ribosylglycohydrolase
MMIFDQDKFRGALLGLAAGDALGTTVEFSPRGTFTPLTDMVGGGPFHLKPGEWTDDTSMALCLGQSLVECDGMNLTDQLDRYRRWWLDGENSSTGECFDIGNTVRSALEAYARTGDPYSGSTHPMSAGNGSIMRLAPVPMFFANDTSAAIKLAAESSRTTHGAVEAVDACRLLASLIVGLLTGKGKEEILSADYPGSVEGLDDLCPHILAIAQGCYQGKSQDEIKGSGYVVQSLEAALWAFWNSEDFEQGALLAVNLGDDADTTGAVYGQIAGACYGVGGIPKEWLAKLGKKDLLLDLADQIHLRLCNS